jgi:hypothetical protein
VANAVLYTTVANVAAIPVSPANNTAIEVTNSTGIESFTPLSGLPAGFVGSSGLSVRIIYQTVGSTWTWIQYFPNDPENRYFKLSGGTITGPITVPQGTVSSPGVKFSGTGNDNTGVYSPGIDELGLVTNGTARLTIDSAGAVAIPGTLGVTGAITGSLTGAASSNVLKAGDTMTGALVHPLGAAATPSITFTGDTNTGIYSSGADQVAISTNGSGRLYVDASGNVGINKFALSQTFHVLSASGGTTARFENSSSGNFIDFFETGGGTRMGYIGHTSATGMAVHNDKNGPIVFDTNNTERMRLDSSGRLGLGTSSPSLQLTLNSSDTTGTGVRLENTSSGGYNWSIFSIGSAASLAPVGCLAFRDATNAATRLVIDPIGRVGIGVTSPGSLLHVEGGQIYANRNGAGTQQVLQLNNSDTTAGTQVVKLAFGSSGTTKASINAAVYGNDYLTFNTGSDTERARIDSSGRLLVGTSSTSGNADAQTALIQTIGNSSASFQGGRINIGRAEFSANITSGEQLGGIYFSDAQSGTYGVIECVADGTGGSNDFPGRLVFSTTADGASSPTEALRINNDGSIVGGGNINSANLFSGPGFSLRKGSGSNFEGLSLSKTSTSWGTALYIHRSFSAGDGTLIEFAHDTATEGTISVSGTTVSYNGGHLSRWSQNVDADETISLLKGTVMTNLDEMCEWHKEDGALEDNEQLNKMAVSSIAGDPNVAGVLVNIDEDGDLNVGMTGDMIIRIAEGVTVQRGDLLMSAGDGTAKPQDDDIIRSKTIAKVTSTHVTCTYDDGSYCVPCVLMAC